MNDSSRRFCAPDSASRAVADVVADVAGRARRRGSRGPRARARRPGASARRARHPAAPGRARCRRRSRRPSPRPSLSSSAACIRSAGKLRLSRASASRSAWNAPSKSLQLPPHDGEVEPQADVAAIARECALESRPRAAGMLPAAIACRAALFARVGLVVHAAASLRFCRFRASPHNSRRHGDPRRNRKCRRPARSSPATAASGATRLARRRRSTGCSPRTRGTFRR